MAFQRKTPEGVGPDRGNCTVSKSCSGKHATATQLQKQNDENHSAEGHPTARRLLVNPDNGQRDDAVFVAIPATIDLPRGVLGDKIGLGETIDSGARRKRTPCSFLRSIVSTHRFGIRPPGEQPKHMTTNLRMERCLNKRPGNFPCVPKNAELDAHASGEATYYFTGSARGETLVLIDVDCKRMGTRDGALRFLHHLKSVFGRLFIEESTNGNGGHGYFILQTGDKTEREINALLGRLEWWLRTKMQGFDIENVEIKGRCPVVERKGGRLTVASAGTLAKIPRGFKSPAFATTTRISFASVDDWTKGYFQRPVESRKQAKRRGSTFGAIEVKVRDNHLLAATLLMNRSAPRCGHQLAISREDVALVLAMIEAFTRRGNPDGAMPTRRFEHHWNALHDEGRVRHAWNHHRFKAIRDWLSDHGLIHWCDHRYTLGQACRWSMSATLENLLAEVREDTDGTLLKVLGIGHVEGRGTVPLKHRWPVLTNRETRKRPQSSEFCQMQTV